MHDVLRSLRPEPRVAEHHVERRLVRSPRHVEPHVEPELPRDLVPDPAPAGRDIAVALELVELVPLSEDGALQYTHSGSRYLLGYAENFFGIWDRAAGETPVARFPRTDEGWKQAWTQFKAWEPYSAEVGIGPSRSEPTIASPGGFGARPDNPTDAVGPSARRKAAHHGRHQADHGVTQASSQDVRSS